MVSNGFYPAENDEGDRELQFMPESRQIKICEQWIKKNCVRTLRMRRAESSYNFKHMVEHDRLVEKKVAYVSNGAFIQAALNLGYAAARVQPGSLNAFFNMRLAFKRAALSARL